MRGSHVKYLSFKVDEKWFPSIVCMYKMFLFSGKYLNRDLKFGALWKPTENHKIAFRRYLQSMNGMNAAVPFQLIYPSSNFEFRGANDEKYWKKNFLICHNEVVKREMKRKAKLFFGQSLKLINLCYDKCERAWISLIIFWLFFPLFSSRLAIDEINE